MPEQQPQGQQIPMEDVIEIYGNETLMLKLSIKGLQREVARLTQALEAAKAKPPEK